MGQPVVMGRRTWDSIPARFRPLPGRRNIVVTRNRKWYGDGAERVGSLEEAFDLASDGDEVFVIGGAQVYAEALAAGLVDRLVVTRVNLAPQGDTYFPDLDWDDWIETSRDVHAESEPGYVIATYERRD